MFVSLKSKCNWSEQDFQRKQQEHNKEGTDFQKKELSDYTLHLKCLKKKKNKKEKKKKKRS